MSDALTPNPDHEPHGYHRIPSSAYTDDYKVWLGERVIDMGRKIESIIERTAKHSAQIAHHDEHIADLTAKVETLQAATQHLPAVRRSLVAIAVASCVAVIGGLTKAFGVL